ncbi:hypothetical protein VTK56DRAFT_3893 [Thermocarpiscus australiensis]
MTYVESTPLAQGGISSKEWSNGLTTLELAKVRFIRRQTVVVGASDIPQMLSHYHLPHPSMDLWSNIRDNARREGRVLSPLHPRGSPRLTLTLGPERLGTVGLRPTLRYLDSEAYRHWLTTALVLGSSAFRLSGYAAALGSLAAALLGIDRSSVSDARVASRPCGVRYVLAMPLRKVGPRGSSPGSDDPNRRRLFSGP